MRARRSLAALAGADLHDVAAVVVRWYGGTNLGVGGLVRAYGGALARALDGAPVVRCERAADVRLRYGHELTAAVMRCVSGHGGPRARARLRRGGRRAALPRSARAHGLAGALPA